jgi:aminoglycoside phosphotransferase family enzyme
MINEVEVEKSGLDPEKVKKLDRMMIRFAREAKKLHIEIFGGTGSLSLRYHDDDNMGELILAEVGGNISGGDGADHKNWGDGLNRGE